MLYAHGEHLAWARGQLWGDWVADMSLNALPHPRRRGGLTTRSDLTRVCTAACVNRKAERRGGESYLTRLRRHPHALKRSWSLTLALCQTQPKPNPTERNPVACVASLAHSTAILALTWAICDFSERTLLQLACRLEEGLTNPNSTPQKIPSRPPKETTLHT